MKPGLAEGLAVGVLSVLILLNSQSVSAQPATPVPTRTPTATPTATATPTPTPTPTPAATTPLPEIKVTKVTGHLALFNTITVEVENLTEYLKRPGRDPKKFILYLDGRPLKGVNSRLAAGANTLLFDVKRPAECKEECKEQWDALLGRPFLDPKGFTYPVSVSIGYENENPIPTNVDNDQKYSLVVVNKIGFWIFVVAFGFALFGFWWLAKNTGIIRDPCLELKDPKERPYSLGRAQMAFWFFVVATSYMLIWLITSRGDSLTEQAIGLIGISTATALGAAVVGSSKTSTDANTKKALEQEKAALLARLTQFESERAAQPDKVSDLNKEQADKSARLDQIEKDLKVLNERATPLKSEGFIDDILSDAEGYSLHRFQMAIWTLVLGIVFVASVYNSLAMPEFSGTLLGLMGISGGTYIGFKFPEKQG